MKKGENSLGPKEASCREEGGNGGGRPVRNGPWVVSPEVIVYFSKKSNQHRGGNSQRGKGVEKRKGSWKKKNVQGSTTDRPAQEKVCYAGRKVQKKRKVGTGCVRKRGGGHTPQAEEKRKEGLVRLKKKVGGGQWDRPRLQRGVRRKTARRGEGLRKKKKGGGKEPCVGQPVRQGGLKGGEKREKKKGGLGYLGSLGKNAGRKRPSRQGEDLR